MGMPHVAGNTQSVSRLDTTARLVLPMAYAIFTTLMESKIQRGE